MTALLGAFDELADQIDAWRISPARMVRELFNAEPDPPQERALELFPHSPRIALQACTGSGKSCALAWMGWNFMLTRPHPAIGVTSVSGDNLKTALWAELARWRGQAPLLQHLFEQTKTEIFHREHRHTWRMEARAWAKDADANQIGSALRGLHSKYVAWLLDETGGYPDAVLPVCEAIFSGDPIEAHIVQAGNPQKRSGPLWHAATHRALWKVIEITADPDDPGRTSRVSVQHAQEQIDQWSGGRDNPWVVVNILGRFPPSDINSLIGPDEVSAAMKRYYREYEIGEAPKIIGVDVALYGDDASVIFSRHGLQAFPPIVHRNINGTQGAGLVARLASDFGADAIFIDATGGFGSSWIDQLINLGRSPIGVQFSEAAHNSGRYYNKRTEMYFDAIAWIRRGGALPDCPELLSDLAEVQYTFKGDRLLLEDKASVKKRLKRSPDWGDAFVLMHAEPILPKARTYSAPQIKAEDYNPFQEPARRREPARVYDAFR